MTAIIEESEATEIRKKMCRFLTSKIIGGSIECNAQGRQMTMIADYPQTPRSYEIACDLKNKLNEIFYHTKIVAVTPVDGRSIASFFCSGFKKSFTEKAA